MGLASDERARKRLILVSGCFSGIKTLIVVFTVEDITSSVHNTLAWKFSTDWFSIISRTKPLLLLDWVAEWITRLATD